MSDELLVRWCAPTLASLKTGSLFTCPFDSREAMLCALRALNRRLGGHGLRILPLRYHAGRGLIYVYRPALLARDLRREDAAQLLREQGYGDQDAAHCVLRLLDRLHGENGFPHEIGLFLGYPPADVAGFMYRRSECKCTGMWKVYGDVASAQRSFALYRRCTDAYLRLLSGGTAIEQLAVPTR